ncbi:MAG: nucleotidyltransferase [Chitinophagaceae bacterium]|nr:nucleotidyltransferase [Chitinophagaceae bacterium]
MDIYDDGFLELWKVLNKHNVQYIMVGGFAVNMHGYTRATKDADLWLKDTIENRKNLRKAFKELGYGDFESVETMKFLPGWTQFYLNNGVLLDIMTEMKGIERLSFDDCLSKASIADFEGIQVPFLHINHLLANKKAVDRPKDKQDIIELEKIKELRIQMGLNSPE